MKRRKALLCSGILLLFVVFTTYSKNIQETKTARATYSVSNTDRIEIEGKNVLFQIATGPAGRVALEASIVFKGRETDKIREFLDNFEEEVQSRISQGGGRLSIDADLDEPFKVQMGKRGGTRVGYSEEELKITYTLIVPAANNLSVKNSYRDILLTGNYTGAVSVGLYSANFRGQAFNSLDLELKFGKAEIERIEKSVMKLYEEKIAVREIGELELESKFSRMEVNVLGSVVLDSYESKLDFLEMGELRGTAKFGRINSEGAMSSIELDCYEVDMEFGDIGMMKLPKSKFSNVKAGKIENLVLPDSYEDSFVVQELGGLEANAKFSDFEIERFSGSARIEGYETDTEIRGVSSGARLIMVDGKFNKLYLNARNIPFQLKGDLTFGDIDYPEESVQLKVYIKENNKLQIEIVSKSGNPALSIDLRGYETKAEIQ
jgi:hypothetical protein